MNTNDKHNNIDDTIIYILSDTLHIQYKSMSKIKIIYSTPTQHTPLHTRTPVLKDKTYSIKLTY